MNGFELEKIESMTLQCRGRLTNMYVLSPFVWKTGERYGLLLRAVPKRDDEPRLKMAEAWYGASTDGLHFVMDPGPTLFPGPDAADLDGCEDPTVIVEDDTSHVWYTGWNQKELTGRLLYASGPDAQTLTKRGIALDSVEPYRNPKEATVVSAADGAVRANAPVSNQAALAGFDASPPQTR